MDAFYSLSTMFAPEEAAFPEPANAIISAAGGTDDQINHLSSQTQPMSNDDEDVLRDLEKHGGPLISVWCVIC
jgi:hypothetical protein